MKREWFRVKEKRQRAAGEKQQTALRGDGTVPVANFDAPDSLFVPRGIGSNHNMTRSHTSIVDMPPIYHCDVIRSTYRLLVAAHSRAYCKQTCPQCWCGT